MKRTTPLLLVLALAACGADPAGPEAELLAGHRCADPAPLNGRADPATPNQYIVVFRDGVDAQAAAGALAARFGFQTKHVYEHALLGFSATMDAAAVAGVRCDERVRYVEHDALFTIG